MSTTPLFLPIPFEVPAVNPSPNGLYGVTTWTEEGPDDPHRWLSDGVQFRVHNYGGDGAFGLWDVGWCDDPGSNLKAGARPAFLDAFAPFTAWGYDECDMTEDTQQDVLARAAQNLRLREQTAVEHGVAVRMLSDVTGSPESVDNIIEAVGYIEGQFAIDGTVGFIHASAELAAMAASALLIVRSGSTLKTPMGHTWVFGGGYVAGLGGTLIGSSPTYGWRDQPEVRSAFKPSENTYAAVAERSVVIGYEALVGAAAITP